MRACRCLGVITLWVVGWVKCLSVDVCIYNTCPSVFVVGHVEVSQGIALYKKYYYYYYSRLDMVYQDSPSLHCLSRFGVCTVLLLRAAQ